jgi:hypothetical protein
MPFFEVQEANLEQLNYCTSTSSKQHNSDLSID